MAALAPVFCNLNVRAAVPHPAVTQGHWSPTNRPVSLPVCLQVTPTFLGHATGCPTYCGWLPCRGAPVQLALRSPAYGAHSIVIQLVWCTSQSLSNIQVL